MAQAHYARFVLLIVLAVAGASAFRKHDPVSAMRRVQHKAVRAAAPIPVRARPAPHHPPQWRTEWTEMPKSQLPHFGVSSAVKLEAPLLAKGSTADEAFKMHAHARTHAALPASHALTCVCAYAPFLRSFSFDNERFVVPWASVWSGTGEYLDVLDITFHHTGDQIRRVTWRPVCAYRQGGCAACVWPLMQRRCWRRRRARHPKAGRAPPVRAALPLGRVCGAGWPPSLALCVCAVVLGHGVCGPACPDGLFLQPEVPTTRGAAMNGCCGVAGAARPRVGWRPLRLLGQSCGCSLWLHSAAARCARLGVGYAHQLRCPAAASRLLLSDCCNAASRRRSPAS